MLFQKNYMKLIPHYFVESNDSEKKQDAAELVSRWRYPKVFTTEQKKLADERDKAHFEQLGMDNRIRSYSTKNNDNTNCDNSIQSLIKAKKNNCSAIKYGSDPNPQNWKNWYTCPRIYDIYSNMPLHYTMLTYNHPQIKGDFIPLDYEDINKWRTHIDGTTDITDFNPTYEGRGIIKNTSKISANRKNSILLLPKSSDYSYPGFMSGTKHPEGLFSPCCYKGTNKNVSSAFGVTQKWNKTYNSYIQGVHKDLGYSPRRIGMLYPKIFRNIRKQ